MRIRDYVLATVSGLILSSAAMSHHPGGSLDQEIGGMEKYFQVIDRPAPPFELVTAAGKRVGLPDLADRVVVLHFIYTSCPDVCPLHAEKLAEVQSMIAATPMEGRVYFVSITTDPVNDTPGVLAAYGPARGLDPGNWLFLTIGPEQDENRTRLLAESYGHRFDKGADGYQVHGVVSHVIDRGGRWAANFHGLEFDSLNMVLYINGLMNNSYAAEEASEPSWWDRFRQIWN